MAGDRVNPIVAHSPVDDYLGEFATLLHGPRRRRAMIMAELRDGLEQAAGERMARGVARAAAQQQAVREFGAARAVAAAFAGELATAYARRTIAAFIVTGPLVGIWWFLLMRPHPMHAGVIALLVAIPVLPLVAVAIAIAATILATTGRLIRWLPEASPRRAIVAVVALAGLVLAADATVIGVYLQSGIPWRLLAVIAVAASFVRIVASACTLRSATVMWRSTAGSIVTPSGGGRVHP